MTKKIKKYIRMTSERRRELAFKKIFNQFNNEEDF